MNCPFRYMYSTLLVFLIVFISDFSRAQEDEKRNPEAPGDRLKEMLKRFPKSDAN